MRKKAKVLPATAESPALARTLVRNELAGCAEAAVTAAELMISELVTNAVVHGETPIEVEIQHKENTVIAAVSDGSSDLPVPRHPVETDANGRGLMIVRALAHDWGVVERDAGKSVWFALPCR